MYKTKLQQASWQWYKSQSISISSKKFAITTTNTKLADKKPLMVLIKKILKKNILYISMKKI